jgi:outer membrane murein-binding lipoprotein Lpp
MVKVLSSPRRAHFTLIIPTSMKRYLLPISAALMGVMLMGAGGCADEVARKKIDNLESKVAVVSNLEAKIEELSSRIADLEAKVAEMSAKKEERAQARMGGGAPRATQPAQGAPAGKVK